MRVVEIFVLLCRISMRNWNWILTVLACWPWNRVVRRSRRRTNLLSLTLYLKSSASKLILLTRNVRPKCSTLKRENLQLWMSTILYSTYTVYLSMLVKESLSCFIAYIFLPLLFPFYLKNSTVLYCKWPCSIPAKSLIFCGMLTNDLMSNDKLIANSLQFSLCCLLSKMSAACCAKTVQNLCNLWPHLPPYFSPV